MKISWEVAVKNDINYLLNVFYLIFGRYFDIYARKRLGCTPLVAYSGLNSTIAEHYSLARESSLCVSQLVLSLLLLCCMWAKPTKTLVAVVVCLAFYRGEIYSNLLTSAFANWCSLW